MSEDNSSIVLKLQSCNQEFLWFRIKKSGNLEKLKLAFCQRFGLDGEHTQIYFDGRKIADGETAMSLELMEGDLLDVVQTSGNGAGGETI